MKNIVVIITVILTFLEGQHNVSKVGTTANQFLKIGIGARATAMGDAFVAVADDASGIFWNPSGMALLNKSQAVFSNNQWLADITIMYGAALFKTGPNNSIGIFVNTLSTPEDLVRTVHQPEGTGEKFSSSNLALGISYARKVTDRFSYGVTGKYIQEQIWTMSSSTIALDIGVLYKTSIDQLTLGFSIVNFGIPSRMRGRANLINVDPDPLTDGNNEMIRARLDVASWELPLATRIGIAYKAIENDLLKVSLALDGVHPNDNFEYLNTGVEIRLSQILSLRGGFRGIGINKQEGGLSFGIGINLPIAGNKDLQINYSTVDYGVLNWVNRYSIIIPF